MRFRNLETTQKWGSSRSFSGVPAPQLSRFQIPTARCRFRVFFLEGIVSGRTQPPQFSQGVKEKAATDQKQTVTRWFKPPWPFDPLVFFGHQQTFETVSFSSSQRGHQTCLSKRLATRGNPCMYCTVCPTSCCVANSNDQAAGALGESLPKLSWSNTCYFIMLYGRSQRSCFLSVWPSGTVIFRNMIISCHTTNMLIVNDNKIKHMMIFQHRDHVLQVGCFAPPKSHRSSIKQLYTCQKPSETFCSANMIFQNNHLSQSSWCDIEMILTHMNSITYKPSAS